VPAGGGDGRGPNRRGVWDSTDACRWGASWLSRQVNVRICRTRRNIHRDVAHVVEHQGRPGVGQVGGEVHVGQRQSLDVTAVEAVAGELAEHDRREIFFGQFRDRGRGPLLPAAPSARTVTLLNVTFSILWPGGASISKLQPPISTAVPPLPA
jgi:hypothetical protein